MNRKAKGLKQKHMTKKESLSEKIFKYYVLTIFICMAPLIIKDMLLGWTLFLAAISFPPIVSALYKYRKRKRFFESRNTLEKIRRLTPRQFEEFVCEVFGRLGFAAKAVGKPSDGGIDLVIKKDGERHYVQCKKYVTSQVSVGAMRDFYGAVVDRLSTAKAFFITTNIFTLEAELFARGKPIELIDGEKLMKYVRLAGMASSVPMRARLFPHECPKCGAKMVVRIAQTGINAGKRFYGCLNYPNCRFTKEVARYQ